VDRVTAAIAVGSSLGDREAHVAFARSQLTMLLDHCRLSTVVETEPIDVPGDAGRFLNAAAVGGTDLSARDLLTALHDLERQRGRRRPHVNAPRTLDLDLILFGSAIIDEPDLVVPHPRFRTRRFVLEPLAEIAPDLRDPVTGKRVADLLAALGAA
jgi:2-amino-4-hydroxy-6-hydroxymethyldihydropteridine diphosphokinase